MAVSPAFSTQGLCPFSVRIGASLSIAWKEREGEREMEGGRERGRKRERREKGREGEGERERGGGRERGRERGRKRERREKEREREGEREEEIEGDQRPLPRSGDGVPTHRLCNRSASIVCVKL